MGTDNKLDELSIEKDADLLMEFRQTYYEMWVKFCAERGYHPDVGEFHC